MNQEIARIKSEDKKAIGKFIIYMVLALIGGGLFGLATVVVKCRGVEVVNRILLDAVFALLPYGIPVVTVVVFIIVTVIYQKSRKTFGAWDGEDEEVINRVENHLSYALWLTSMNTIWNYFVFGTAFCLDYWTVVEKRYELNHVGVMVGAFLIGIIVLVIEQQKIVNLEKEINPEKRGSVYDSKFWKKWEESCDEAELFINYKSSYKAFQITQNLCIGMWLFCIMGGFIWDFGAVPILIISIIWGTMVTSYTMESIRLSKKGGR